MMSMTDKLIGISAVFFLLSGLTVILHDSMLHGQSWVIISGIVIFLIALGFMFAGIFMDEEIV